jgi:hypothetical protein
VRAHQNDSAALKHHAVSVAVANRRQPPRYPIYWCHQAIVRK